MSTERHSLRGAFLVVLCTLADSASAGTPRPVVVENHVQLLAAIESARNAAIADCRAKSQTVLFQHPYVAEKRVEYTWSFRNPKGLCVDGRRAGVVSLELTETTRDFLGGKLETATQTSATWDGELVDGVGAGLWCRGPEIRKVTQHGSKRLESAPLPTSDQRQCVLNASPDRQEGMSGFVRRGDGRWVRFGAGETPGIIEELIPAGVLEARSASIVEAVRAGEKPPEAAPLTLEIPQIADLVKGGSALYAPEMAPRDLKKRTVGLVLTTRAGDELRSWTAAREALIAATPHLKARDAGGYQRFLIASDPRRLLEAMAQGLRPHARRLLPLVDLAPLAAGEVDYAIVVDWKIELRADVLGKYDALRKTTGKFNVPELVTTRVGYLLLDRDFKVVARWNTNGGLPPFSFGATDWRLRAGRGDPEYLYQLTQQLVRQWGVVEPLQSAFSMVHYSLAPLDGGAK